MSVYENILKRRTIRRFQAKRVPYRVLEKCINAARVTPSAQNLQPCEYLVVDEESTLDKVFVTLHWAGYIPNGKPPKPEVPRAYIIVLINTDIVARGYQHDVGFALENIILTALEEGIGCCCFGAVDKKKLRENLSIPSKYIIDLVVALGYPKESPVEEPLTDSVKYWKDENKVLHVPKRRLEDIFHRNAMSE